MMNININDINCFEMLGDIGGRCSDCRPGSKGDKGERGYDGIPGALGNAYVLLIYKK